MGFAVDHYLEGFFKTDHSEVFILIKAFNAIQEFHVVISLIYEGIDRKIPDPERGKVLEEMSSLTWVNTIIFKT